MAKRKEKKSKRSVLSTIALALFALVLAGFVFDAVNDHVEEPKEEAPVVETLKLDIQDESDSSITYTIEYEEGMTWGDWVVSDYNTFGVEVLHIYDVDGVTIAYSYISKIKGQNHNNIDPHNLIHAESTYFFRASE